MNTDKASIRLCFSQVLGQTDIVSLEVGKSLNGSKLAAAKPFFVILFVSCCQIQI